MPGRQFDNFVEDLDKIVEYIVIPPYTKALHTFRMDFDKIVELVWIRFGGPLRLGGKKR